MRHLLRRASLLGFATALLASAASLFIAVAPASAGWVYEPANTQINGYTYQSSPSYGQPGTNQSAGANGTCYWATMFGEFYNVSYAKLEFGNNECIDSGTYYNEYGNPGLNTGYFYSWIQEWDAQGANDYSVMYVGANQWEQEQSTSSNIGEKFSVNVGYPCNIGTVGNPDIVWCAGWQEYDWTWT